MSSLEIDEVAINLELFKIIRFYHILDPSSRKLFNFNVYRLTLVFFTIILLCITSYGQFGWFIEMDDHMDDMTAMISIFTVLMFFSHLLKVIIFVYNADKIWDILIVAQVHFLTSNKCHKNVHTLQKYKQISLKVTQIMSIFSVGTVLAWSVSPLVFNMMFVHKTNRRMGNILNYRFPVTVYTYNDYYILFYIIELSIIIFNLFVFFANDIFIISFGFVIMAQYEIITKVFESIGYEEHNTQIDDGNFSIDAAYNEFKSILFDLQKLYLKLKLYYSTLWIIILWIVAVNSIAIMMLSYSIIVIYMSAELPILSIGKTIVPMSALCFELFFVCYLMESINIKKESVAFGMYSCNWTAMNLKTKKLLLLTLQMEHANKLIIKTTPLRIVNMQLFDNVMMKSYNIVSVLLKSRST